MKIFSYRFNQSQILELFVIISLTLLNTGYFYNETTTVYYGFCITALFFTITPPNLYSAKNKTVALKTPIVLFGLWCLYVLPNYFTHTATLIFTVYSVIIYFLLLKATSFFSSPNFNFKLRYIGITIIASLESQNTIAQFLGWLNNQNKRLVVTRSWNNPNVIVFYLPLSTVVFLLLFKEKLKKTHVSAFCSTSSFRIT